MSIVPLRREPRLLRSTQTAESVAELREIIGPWKRRSKSVAMVPTMGALHAGHLSLVDRARRLADRVVVSIFVNPLQFNDPKDFDRYPRDLDADISLLASRGVDLVYLPTPEIMYPPGFRTLVQVDQLTDTLCGRSRPGHFDGVTTVVTKLFTQVAPDMAIFGEKDFQQLQVIRRLTRDLDLPVEVIGAPTVREHDGLALSSRNLLLSPEQRAIAPALFRALRSCRDVIVAGRDVTEATGTATEELLSAGFDRVDYLSLVDGDTLAPVTSFTPARAHRLAAAAILEPVRLIDNLAV